MKLNGPNFIIVGAQKCGTSSLFDYLSQNHQIIPAKKKEVHYFDLNYDKGDGWYQEFFPALKEKISLMIKLKKRIITGEASPYYIFHPFAIKRIWKYQKNMKIIILLRNPVERTWSHFRFAKQRGCEDLSFSEALMQENKRIFGEREKMMQDEKYQSSNYQNYSYRKRSEYYSQIKEVFEHFDKENILILKSEDFFSNTQSVMSEVCDFLKIQNTKCDYEIINKGEKKEVIDPVIQNELSEYFKPYNEKLYKLIERDLNW